MSYTFVLDLGLFYGEVVAMELAEKMGKNRGGAAHLVSCSLNERKCN